VKKVLHVAALMMSAALVSTFVGCGGGGSGAQVAPVVFNITTTTLPRGVVGVAYNQTLAVTGGFGARTFSVSAGALPAGLTLNTSTGAITGIPTAPAGTASFTITVVDSSTPAQSDSQALTIDIVLTLGRNDTIANATTLGNGTFAASISPSGNPNNIFSPDVDVYRVTANAGATVSINVTGPGLNPPSPLDPVLEIVNASNVRFSANCRDPGDDSLPRDSPVRQDATPAAFDDQCINDDLSLGVTRDSTLEFKVPGAGVVTFYLRVLDFRGDARPDMRYEITISGAN
jgi:hypothetical protein